MHQEKMLQECWEKSAALRRQMREADENSNKSTRGQVANVTSKNPLRRVPESREWKTAELDPHTHFVKGKEHGPGHDPKCPFRLALSQAQPFLSFPRILSLLAQCASLQ